MGTGTDGTRGVAPKSSSDQTSLDVLLDRLNSGIQFLDQNTSRYARVKYKLTSIPLAQPNQNKTDGNDNGSLTRLSELIDNLNALNETNFSISLDLEGAI